MSQNSALDARGDAAARRGRGPARGARTREGARPRGGRRGGGRRAPALGVRDNAAVADLPSIDEARGVLLGAVRPLAAEPVPVGDALARVLAEDVVAAADVPAFANSAMDGFAVAAGPAGRALRVVGESRAGEPFAGVVGEGEAVR